MRGGIKVKKYVRPTFKMVQLSAEEGIACGGSKINDNDPLPKFDFDWWFWKPKLNPQNHKKRKHFFKFECL